MNSIGKKIVFSSTTLVLIIFFTEAILHLTGFNPNSQSFIVFKGNPERSLAEKGENYNGQKEIIFVSDDVTFWKFKPSNKINISPKNKTTNDFYSAYTINLRGFRGKEFNKRKSKDVFRIITLGDSITFGLGVKEDKTYYKLLSTELNKEFQPLKVEVISMGVPGYTSYQVLQLLKNEVLSYHPDLVVIYCGGNNEFAKGSYSDREYAQKIKNTFLSKWSNKILTLKLLDLLSQNLKAYIIKNMIPIHKNEENTKFRVPPLNFLEDLSAMKNILDASDVETVFIVPPHSMKSLEQQPYAQEYTSIVKFIGNYASAIDVDSEFKKCNSIGLFAEDEFHPNESGHKIIADSVSRSASEKIKFVFSEPSKAISKHYFSKEKAKELFEKFFKPRVEALYLQAVLTVYAGRNEHYNYEVNAHNLEIKKNNFRQVAYFNGVNSYLETSLALNNLDTFSLGFYVKPDKRQKSDIVTILDNGHDAQQDFTLQSSGLGKNVYTFHCFGKDLTFELPPGVWSYVMVTIDIKNKCFCLYLDGNKQSCSTLPSFARFGSNKLIIGKIGRNNSRYFKGAVSEITIWDKVLNDGEIKALYNDLDLKIINIRFITGGG